MTAAALEAAFYDVAMVDPSSPAMLPLADSPWRPVYREAASWIGGSAPVVDLGCGTGRFADELMQGGREAPVHGVDFSPACVAEASRYAPAATFAVADLRDWLPDAERAGNTVFTCLEVLEHLDDDLDLVARVPVGHRFVFSVPNYHSAAHVRTFRGPGQAWERYGLLLEFRRWSLIDLGGAGKAIHLFDAARRVDAW